MSVGLVGELILAVATIATIAAGLHGHNNHDRY